MKHYEITGADAVHQFAFVQEIDPANDPDNEVTAYKGWYDLSEQRMKIRNAENTGWAYLGVGGGL